MAGMDLAAAPDAATDAPAAPAEPLAPTDPAAPPGGDPRPGRPREGQDPQERPALLRERTGRVLREQRRAAGLRLVDVARRAGVSPQYLSEIERGLKDPSSEMLAAVAEALGLDLDDLLVEVLRRRAATTSPPAPALHLVTAPRPEGTPIRPLPHRSPVVALPHRPAAPLIDPVCRAA